MRIQKFNSSIEYDSAIRNVWIIQTSSEDDIITERFVACGTSSIILNLGSLPVRQLINENWKNEKRIQYQPIEFSAKIINFFSGTYRIEIIFNPGFKLDWDSLSKDQSFISFISRPDLKYYSPKLIYNYFVKLMAMSCKALVRNGKVAHDLLNTIQQSNYQISVTEMSKRYCMSERKFREHFKDVFSITPKLMIQLLKIFVLIKALENSKTKNFYRLSYTMEFADPSHMHRVFKRFVGIRPLEYVREKNFVAHWVYFKNSPGSVINEPFVSKTTELAAIA